MSKKKKSKGKTLHLTQSPHFCDEQESKIREVMKQARWDAFPDMNQECKLPLEKVPSPVDCSHCKIDCPYNRLY